MMLSRSDAAAETPVPEYNHGNETLLQHAGVKIQVESVEFQTHF